MITPILSLQNISFSRPTGDSTRQILHNLSWQVLPGEIAAVLGPNGSGKSTLLRIASGYLWPQHGTVQLLGETFGEAPIAPLRARIGIVEATTIYPFDKHMSARDVVTSGYFSALTIAYVHPTEEQFHHASLLLSSVGLSNRDAQLFATMSTGERLRTLLARALVRKPALLLLDEPTAGLDLPARESILATLTRLHRSSDNPPAMITITHHLEELLPNTTNILLLAANGAPLAQGTPEQVLTNQNLSAAYGVPIQLTVTNNRYHAHLDPALLQDLA
jgi:iron complex transport system ATP-binding protein